MTKSTLFSLAASSVGVAVRLGEPAAGEDRPVIDRPEEVAVPLPKDNAAVGARGGSKFSTRGRLIVSSRLGPSLNLSPVVVGLGSGRLTILAGNVERDGTYGRAPGKGEGSGDSSSRSRLFEVLIPLDAGIRGPSTTFFGGGSTGRGC